mmetsp:Transcript_10963/g.23030  ORF Transcript_10963/g.23030 Transcript_10963/m.23030 type:complete len:213 (-) Transcript_10963:43-681(-)
MPMGNGPLRFRWQEGTGVAICTGHGGLIEDPLEASPRAATAFVSPRAPGGGPGRPATVGALGLADGALPWCLRSEEQRRRGQDGTEATAAAVRREQGCRLAQRWGASIASSPREGDGASVASAARGMFRTDAVAPAKAWRTARGPQKQEPLVTVLPEGLPVWGSPVAPGDTFPKHYNDVHRRPPVKPPPRPHPEPSCQRRPYLRDLLLAAAS